MGVAVEGWDERRRGVRSEKQRGGEVSWEMGMAGVEGAKTEGGWRGERRRCGRQLEARILCALEVVGHP